MEASAVAGNVSASRQDQRLNEQLRPIFEAACLLIEPFFDPSNSWSGQPLEHFSFRALRDQYPDLSREQIVTLISDARRVYETRKGET